MRPKHAMVVGSRSLFGNRVERSAATSRQNGSYCAIQGLRPLLNRAYLRRCHATVMRAKPRMKPPAMKCPILLNRIVIADDARLAAQVACVLSQPRCYLPVVDGPRMARPDSDAEVIRRNNAAARVKADLIVFAGVSHDSISSFRGRFPSRKVRKVDAAKDVERLASENSLSRDDAMPWGRDRIGIGLLKALRAGARIVFTENRSAGESVPSKSGHLVVCEEGDDLAEVIAANYAFALGAGLHLIPDVTKQQADELLGRLYALYDRHETSPTSAMEQVKHRLCELCGPLRVPDGGSITFITGGLPYGFGCPEVPSTHLFKYPDLGIAVINGFSAEQSGTPGIGAAILVDPSVTDAPEIEAAARLLPPRGAFVRGYEGRAANVTDVTEMIELFPYDLLLIATHCGDVPGYRWTYEFDDSEGIRRSLVVDIAVGVGHTDRVNLVNVTQFMSFVSLDGVDWKDEAKKEKLYVGSAIKDFTAAINSKPPLEPIRKETVPRVLGSAALKMFDDVLIVLPRPLADNGTPIIVNNACVSWHELSERFTFGGARAYIGTLVPIGTSEAHDVVLKLFAKYFDKPLPHALWSAQRDVYGNGSRRPYVMTGVYPQRLRVARCDVPVQLIGRLAAARDGWRRRLRETGNDDEKTKVLAANVAFYERELTGFRRRWGGITGSHAQGSK